VIARVWVVVLMIGCGGKQAPAKPEVDAVSSMTAIADEMCACTDNACVDRVWNEMHAWMETVGKKYSSEADAKTYATLQGISERYFQCHDRLAPPM
jgi:hypothetical protein